MIKRKKKLIYYLIILGLLSYIIFVDNYSVVRLFSEKYNYNKLLRDITLQQEENERLRDENRKLKDDLSILEKKARNMGMKKKDEEIYLFKQKK